MSASPISWVLKHYCVGCLVLVSGRSRLVIELNSAVLTACAIKLWVFDVLQGALSSRNLAGQVYSHHFTAMARFLYEILCSSRVLFGVRVEFIALVLSRYKFQGPWFIPKIMYAWASLLFDVLVLHETVQELRRKKQNGLSLRNSAWMAV